MRRVLVHRPQGRARHLVAERPVPPRRVRLGPVEPVPQRAHQHPVQQPVEHDLVPGPAPAELCLQVVAQRRAVLLVGHHEGRGERPQEPLGKLLLYVIGGGQQHGGAVEFGRTARRGSGVPGLVPAHLPYAAGPPRPRTVHRVVGEDERGRAPDDRRLPDLHPQRLAALRHDPPRTPQRQAQGQIRPVREPQRPGCAQHRTAEHRAPAPHAPQQLVEHVHDVHDMQSRDDPGRSPVHDGRAPMVRQAAAAMDWVP
ncbi:hypothetical protein P376_3252 [Streptomyces sp. HCCB10043]|nr:hypothetical protein P376_3252 [Streptomyces sp. HCCB10043]